ncbi:MAG: DUF3365 domain-containing protein [Nitrospirota bacterium]
MKISELKLSTKFSLSVALILLFFCALLSLLFYYYMKNQVIEDAEEKTRIILAQTKAVGDYIRETLRPRMFNFLHQVESHDDFVVEAMSTTYVTNEVMRHFNLQVSEYTYKRVSENPRNPKNKANPFHSRMIAFFKNNKDQKEWQEIIKSGNQKYLIRVEPVIGEKRCLQCHGNPSEAPKGLIKRYSTEGGFGYKIGEVVGAQSVAVPLDIAIAGVRRAAIDSFIFGVSILFLLLIILHGTFWQMVSKPLKQLSDVFKGIADGTEYLGKKIPSDRSDEIGSLMSSFNIMASHLSAAQDDLRRNIETLQSIFNGISDPLALVNPECSIIMSNKAYREWILKGSPVVLNKRCHEIAHQDDSRCSACILEQVLIEKRAIYGDCKTQDGQHYSVHFYPIFDDSNEVSRVVHYVKNITERKVIEEQIMKTEKLAALGQLSAGIAHEVNNPLGGIRLCFNNLITIEMDEETKKEHIELVNSGFDRIQNIVKLLLDFSKSAPLKLSPCSINKIIENVLRLSEYLITKKEITLIKNLSKDIPELMIDSNKMEQVFLNLIINAIQAMDGSPRVLTIESTVNGGYCWVSVADTGRGIPEEEIPYIFDPFFTTKDVGEGTGLGLTVSRAIVEQHKGEIAVETSEKGTRFTVKLPILSGVIPAKAGIQKIKELDSVSSTE